MSVIYIVQHPSYNGATLIEGFVDEAAAQARCTLLNEIAAPFIAKALELKAKKRMLSEREYAQAAPVIEREIYDNGRDAEEAFASVGAKGVYFQSPATFQFEYRTLPFNG